MEVPDGMGAGAEALASAVALALAGEEEAFGLATGAGWPGEVPKVLAGVADLALRAKELEAFARSAIRGGRVEGRWLDGAPGRASEALEGGYDEHGGKGEPPDGYYDPDAALPEEGPSFVVVHDGDYSAWSALPALDRPAHYGYEGPLCGAAGVAPGAVYDTEGGGAAAAERLNDAFVAAMELEDALTAPAPFSVAEWEGPGWPEGSGREERRELALVGGRWLRPARWERYTEEEQADWAGSLAANAEALLARLGLPPEPGPNEERKE